MINKNKIFIQRTVKATPKQKILGANFLMLAKEAFLKGTILSLLIIQQKWIQRCLTKSILPVRKNCGIL
jgi:hypothetical protein